MCGLLIALWSREPDLAEPATRSLKSSWKSACAEFCTPEIALKPPILTVSIPATDLRLGDRGGKAGLGSRAMGIMKPSSSSSGESGGSGCDTIADRRFSEYVVVGRMKESERAVSGLSFVTLVRPFTRTLRLLNTTRQEILSMRASPSRPQWSRHR